MTQGWIQTFWIICLGVQSMLQDTIFLNFHCWVLLLLNGNSVPNRLEAVEDMDLLSARPSSAYCSEVTSTSSATGPPHQGQ